MDFTLCLVSEEKKQCCDYTQKLIEGKKMLVLKWNKMLHSNKCKTFPGYYIFK